LQKSRPPRAGFFMPALTGGFFHEETMADEIRYSDVLCLRLRPETRLALEAAAKKNGMRNAEFCRHILRAGMASFGITDVHEAA
jgi:hypothetical protein